MQRSNTNLRALPAARIVRAISDAAGRWRDPDFPARVGASAALVARTAYSAEVVEYALDQLFVSIDEAALRATITDELGSLEILDGFAHRSGRPDAFARGLRRVCIIASRTTIGVALLPAVYALCAKCDVAVRDREDQLIFEFFNTLAQEHPAFQAAATTLQWDALAARPPFFRDADALVVFGKNETLRTLRDGTRPHVRFIGYGSRATAGYVTRESLTSRAQAGDLARRAARDVALYETEGCLSLHVLFVESAGALSPQEFSTLFSEAMEQATLHFPAGPRNEMAHLKVDMHRRLASFRGATGKGLMLSDETATYCVVFDPPDDEPPPFLPRTIGLHPVQSPAQALSYLCRHDIPLEGFAMSSRREDVVAMAIEAGAVRLTSFGELQSPPPGGGHGGRPRIGEFVCWIEKEV